MNYSIKHINKKMDTLKSIIPGTIFGTITAYSTSSIMDGIFIAIITGMATYLGMRIMRFIINRFTKISHKLNDNNDQELS